MPEDPQSQVVKLHIPDKDIEQPELSIVIPALNEELTISEFVSWCQMGLAKAGVKGEVLIVDSSTDRTRELALAAGARVLETPKRGLGRAYIDALPYIRGKYVLMGDADLTYDFRLLGAFMECFREGYEFIMGSRFRGYIEDGSMPPLHRYFGTPFTTWILNFLYRGKFTDIHCGMRGISRDGLLRMELRSQSWEYASEMVLKSVHMRLKTTEVPVRFYKDREGRLSHHKRSGWFSPWQAGWINLRAMLVNGVDFFVLKPGIVLILIGLLLTVPLCFGPVKVGAVTFSLYWMLAGLATTILGLQSFYSGCAAQILYDYSGDVTRRWLRIFRYNRSILFSALAFLGGITLVSPLVIDYLRQGLSLPGDVTRYSHLAVMGLLLLSASYINYSFTLLIHAAALYVKPASITK
jgi:glycosyltransferase involved in cell wall biosynthesis